MDGVGDTVEHIRNFEIQGAEKIARAAIEAWSQASDKQRATKELSQARPTEPMLRNVLEYLNTHDGADDLLDRLERDRERLVDYAARKVPEEGLVFTHCHSSTVSAVLIDAKKAGKNFRVNLTETRPIWQGRISARELAREEIPVTYFVDAAGRLALKKADVMVIGADAITSEAVVINKIGSEMFAEIASRYDVPVYVFSHSWKFDPQTIFGYEEVIEQSHKKHTWENPPPGVTINTYAFEKVAPRLVTAIISELGVYKPESFVTEIRDAYEWMWE